MTRRTSLLLAVSSLALASCATFETGAALTITEQTGAVVEQMTMCTSAGSPDRAAADALSSQLGALESSIGDTDTALSDNAAEIAALEAEIADLEERTERMAFILANYEANLNIVARAAHIHDELGGDGNWPVFASGTGPPDLLSSDETLVDLGAETPGFSSVLALPTLVLPPVFISAIVTISGIDARATDRRREMREAAVRASRDMRAEILEFESVPPGISDGTIALALGEIDKFVGDRTRTNMFGDDLADPQWGPVISAGREMGRTLERELEALGRAREALAEASAEASDLLARQSANTAEAADLRVEAIDAFEETCEVSVIGSPTYSDTLWYTSSP